MKSISPGKAPHSRFVFAASCVRRMWKCTRILVLIHWDRAWRSYTPQRIPKSSLRSRQTLPGDLHQPVNLSVSVLIPRIRTIGVRLSEDEYLTLEKFCVESGARSISDLARNAIWSFLNRASQESALASTVNENVAQVKTLQERIARLSEEIALLKAASPAGPDSAEENDELTNEDR